MELLILLIMFYVSVQLYDLQYNAVSSGVLTVGNEITDHDGLRYYDGEEVIYGPEILRDFLDKNRIPGINTRNTIRNSALIVTLWDSEGNATASTSPTNQLMFWQDTARLDPLQQLALDEVFSEEQCRQIREFDQKLKPWAYSGAEYLKLRYMDGYVDADGTWIPLVIQFGGDEEDSTLTLATGKQLPDGAELIRYQSPCKAADLTAVERKKEFVEENLFGDPVRTVMADSWIYLWNTRKDLYEEAAARTGGFNGHHVGSDGVVVSGEQGEYYSYDVWERPDCASARFGEVSWVVDRRGLVLSSDSFRQIWITTMLFMQIVVLLAIRNYGKYEKKNRELQETRNVFLNAVAHELKTPAAVIKNSAECISAGICPEKDPHYLEVIGSAADQVSDLVNHMLVYTRVSDSGYALRREDISVHELVEEALKPYGEMMSRRGIHPTVEIPEGAGMSCDRNLMLLVVKNFLSNAAAYGEENGEIRVRWNENTLSVFNSGPAIGEEEREHLWEPLYRGDESRGSGSESSGMGLAICASILKLHGAEYGVQNVEHGVEFWFRMKA